MGWANAMGLKISDVVFFFFFPSLGHEGLYQCMNEGVNSFWASFLGQGKNEPLSWVTKKMSPFDLREKKENMKESSCQWSSRLLGSVWQSQSTMIAQSLFLQLMEKVKVKGSFQSGLFSILFHGICFPLHFWVFAITLSQKQILSYYLASNGKKGFWI